MIFNLVYGSDLFLKDGENAGIRYFEMDCKDAAICEAGLAGGVSEPYVVLRHCFEMHELVAFLHFFSFLFFKAARSTGFGIISGHIELQFVQKSMCAVYGNYN